MENEQHKVIVEEEVSKWRKLVRQQSAKIFTIADRIVSPIDERISNQIAKLKTDNIRNYIKDESDECCGDQEEDIPQSISLSEVGVNFRTATTLNANRNLQHTTSYALDDLVVRMETMEKAIKTREHFPTFMIGIFVIQVVFYFLFNDIWLTLVFGYDPHRRHEIWRFFTALLVHVGFFHLCGNLVMQLILGVLLEIVHRWKRIAIIYVASGLGGTLYASVWDNTEYAVGASAAAMGLLFSHLATIVMNWNKMDYKFSRIFCVLLYTVWQILSSRQSNKTSNAAHIGGAVTGFTVSVLVLRHCKNIPWKKTVQAICAAILVVNFVFVLVVNLTGLSDDPPAEWNFDYNRTFQEFAARRYNQTERIEFSIFRTTSPW